jgi:hypothetical protein
MWCDAPHPTLAVIERHESGGRNVMNYINDPWHTAGGFWQITNTTWRGTAPFAGVSLTQYPTAISAPCEVQRAVAGALFARLGVLPWAPFNAELAAQVGYTGPMYDENGQPVASLYRQAAAFYGRAIPRERRHSTEVWE